MAVILLVDDEPEIVFLTKKLLEKEGHVVRVAKNGKECVMEIQKEKPKLILLDIMMPGEDGWEVCRKIKKDRRTKAVPVVMFTVRTSMESMEKSRFYAGADAQINKPFKKEELLEIVSRFLG